MDDSFKTLLEQAKSLLKILQAPIIEFSNAKLSIFTILMSLAVVVLSFRIAHYLGRMLNKQLQKKEVDSGIRDSLEKFLRYLIIGFGILFSLDNLGVSFNSLAAIGAVLMVGIGFGLQNITQNFFSGIIILIERPIKVGDIIQVGETSGRIVDIRVRSTIVQTRDDISIIVPNSKLVSEEVINKSFTGQRIRQHVRVGVAYGSNIELVQSLLVEATKHSKVLASPAPICVFEDFGDSSLNFDVRFWCSDIWEMENICSDIRCQIDRLFRENQVAIPFPQRDIHIKTPQGRALS
jgi:small-conductance mechanosensitive channel